MYLDCTRAGTSNCINEDSISSLHHFRYNYRYLDYMAKSFYFIMTDLKCSLLLNPKSLFYKEFMFGTLNLQLIFCFELYMKI